jgi:hypothetical protein
MCADDMAQALKFYNQHDFASATKFCQSELHTNPKSASAHYLLGSMDAQLQHNDEAFSEFAAAIVIDPKGPVGAMSRQCIDRLAHTMPSPSVSASDKSAAKEPDQKSAPSKPAAATIVKDEKLQNADVVTKKMSQMRSDLEAQCKAEVDRLTADADTNIKWLQSEMQRKIDENGPPMYAGGLLRWTPEPLNRPIREQYEGYIKGARENCERRIADMQALYKAKEDAVDDSASSLQQSYEHRNQGGNIILTPVGTNGNVRNYQTSDEASGNPVQMVAPPAKSMQTKAPTSPKKQ